jgi:hypothetical protein
MIQLIMSLTQKQKGNLRSLNKLESHIRASVNNKTRHKLETDLDRLEDIDIILSHLPREHARKAVKDKHIVKAMKILLALLDLREFKRVRQDTPGEEGYVIKKHRGRYYKRTPLTQKDYNRYLAMRNFYINYRKYFNPSVVLPGDINTPDISPTYTDWVYFDDHVDYYIYVQQTYGPLLKPLYNMSGPEGKRIKEIEMKIFDPKMDSETKMKLVSEHTRLSAQVIQASINGADLPSAKSDAELDKLSQEAIQRNIDATNDWIEFFKSTH